MTVSRFVISACVAGLFAAQASAEDLTDWVKQYPVKPDPTKVIVPPGYKVGVFASGISTPSAATVDKDGNVWVAISGNLFGGRMRIRWIRPTSRSTTRAAS